MSPNEYASALREFASAVKRLPLADWRAPEAPYEAREHLANTMLMTASRWDAWPAEPLPARGRFEPGVVQVDGSIVRVEVRRRERRFSSGGALR